MKLWESLDLAIKNIAGSKMRTLLTMLGIIIGIGAVMLIVGVGNGLSQYMTDSFAELGTNNISVTIMGRGSSRSISDDEMYEFVAENSDMLDLISPTVSMTDSVKIGNETMDSTVATGISEDYFEISGYELSQGRGITYMDLEERNQVCVIGEYLNQTYYDGAAVGQTLKVGANRYTIVGIMEQESDDEDLDEGCTDDCVFTPYTTAARFTFMGTIENYTITVVDENTISECITLIEDHLYDVFGSEVYMVMSLSEMLDTMNEMVDIVVTILSCIAAISLVVGGIGIMNIMLVSVTERTREIGIRKALGSKERYIMQQFVIEAATTSALGGCLGIILGYALSAIATSVSSAMLGTAIHVSPGIEAVALAVSVSIGIGILFGYLPAKKAARLNPIDALRYD
ncbi:ABC transporter permease [Bengtsoniella intestinalis]|uniref:ABC transporter permease n=1 Tax=Bengtsoniella intestinalis TaxID=3073143 RepID=UPI00391FC9E5